MTIKNQNRLDRHLFTVLGLKPINEWAVAGEEEHRTFESSVGQYHVVVNNRNGNVDVYKRRAEYNLNKL